MPNKPKTPNRIVRVDDDLWREFGEACQARGVNRSDLLRAYMKREVAAHKRRMTQAQKDQAESERE